MSGNYQAGTWVTELTSKRLNVFRVSGHATGGAIRLRHLSPQTEEFSIG